MMNGGGTNRAAAQQHKQEGLADPRHTHNPAEAQEQDDAEDVLDGRDVDAKQHAHALIRCAQVGGLHGHVLASIVHEVVVLHQVAEDAGEHGACAELGLEQGKVEQHIVVVCVAHVGGRHNVIEVAEGVAGRRGLDQTRRELGGPREDELNLVVLINVVKGG